MTSKKLEWKDISQAQTKNVLHSKIGGSEIRIWRHLHESQWSLDALDLGIDRKNLKSTDLEAAKLEALDIIKDKVKRVQEKLSLINDDLKLL